MSTPIHRLCHAAGLLVRPLKRFQYGEAMLRCVHARRNHCKGLVQATGIWAQLQRTKTLVCEPHGTGEAFDNAMKTYYDAIAEGRGAIFFAICRGKVSPADNLKPYIVLYQCDVQVNFWPALHHLRAPAVRQPMMRYCSNTQSWGAFWVSRKGQESCCHL